MRKYGSRDGPVASEKVNRGPPLIVNRQKTHVFLPESSYGCAELAKDVLARCVADAQLDGRYRRRRRRVVGRERVEVQQDALGSLVRVELRQVVVVRLQGLSIIEEPTYVDFGQTEVAMRDGG